MPSEALRSERPVTRSELVRDLRKLGVCGRRCDGAHADERARVVVGGTETLVRSLLDVVGPDGTVMALAGWADDLYHVGEWPPEWQEAYRTEFPPFDPALSEAAKEMVGRIPERIRTWPGARRSDHPEASVVALGADADASRAAPRR